MQPCQRGRRQLDTALLEQACQYMPLQGLGVLGFKVGVRLTC